MSSEICFKAMESVCQASYKFLNYWHTVLIVPPSSYVHLHILVVESCCIRNQRQRGVFSSQAREKPFLPLKAWYWPLETFQRDGWDSLWSRPPSSLGPLVLSQESVGRHRALVRGKAGSGQRARTCGDCSFWREMQSREMGLGPSPLRQYEGRWGWWGWLQRRQWPYGRTLFLDGSSPGAGTWRFGAVLGVASGIPTRQSRDTTYPSQCQDVGHENSVTEGCFEWCVIKSESRTFFFFLGWKRERWACPSANSLIQILCFDMVPDLKDRGSRNQEKASHAFSKP